MMTRLLLLLLFGSFIEVSISMNYECTDDDCWFYDTPDDPRKLYLDLYMKVEMSINSTLRVPSWKMHFKFFDGKLKGYPPGDFGLECACPLIVEEDKVFVTFHANYTLELTYSYKVPSSKGKYGQLMIACDFQFSSLLLNQTNHPPVFQKVKVTDLNIFSFYAYDAPFEWLADLPDKYMNQLQKTISTPIKRLIEDSLRDAFNQRLKKLYGDQVPKGFQPYGIHSNSVH